MRGDAKEAGSSLLFISSHHSFLPPPVCSVHERPGGGARARAREHRLHNNTSFPSCAVVLWHLSFPPPHEDKEAAPLNGQNYERKCVLLLKEIHLIYPTGL